MRLQATSSEDLKVLSALLQDSIVPIADILYTPSQKQVIMVLQRFRWELIKNAKTKICEKVVPNIEKVMENDEMVLDGDDSWCIRMIHGA